jgi:hypothetical protein
MRIKKNRSFVGAAHFAFFEKCSALYLNRITKVGHSQKRRMRDPYRSI